MASFSLQWKGKRAAIWLAFFAVFTLSACASSPARLNEGVMIEEVTTFNQIAPVVQTLNQQYKPENVLIVSDIDNTLLTNNGGLGGDIWYQWQRGKLAVKPSPEQTVSCLFEDVIGMLYELSPMALTESQVPGLIEQWQAQGNPIMLLTSRSPDYRSPTERELYNKGIDASLTALAPSGETDVTYRELLDREMSYSRGIMMTTGMHKGDMLAWILAKTGREFDAIVFIDDSQHNIDNMHERWQHESVDMRVFHYTHVEAERVEIFGQVLSAEQANDLASDYAQLTQTLKAIFPERYKEGQCLRK